MKTKEAIEVIKHDLDLCLNDGIDKNDLFKAIDSIEDKLKRGEKFEKMYDKIKFIAGFNISVDEEYDQVCNILEEYVKNMKVKRILIRTNRKQKYFPKEE